MAPSVICSYSTLYSSFRALVRVLTLLLVFLLFDSVPDYKLQEYVEQCLVLLALYSFAHNASN